MTRHDRLRKWFHIRWALEPERRRRWTDRSTAQSPFSPKVLDFLAEEAERYIEAEQTTKQWKKTARDRQIAFSALHLKAEGEKRIDDVLAERFEVRLDTVQRARATYRTEEEVFPAEMI